MLPAIGIMVGLYIITQSALLLSEHRRHPVGWLAALTILAAAYFVVELAFTGTAWMRDPAPLPEVLAPGPSISAPPTDYDRR